MVDSYDIMLDSDFVLILDIYVKSKKFGEKHYRESYKGSFRNHPIEYIYEDEKDN